MVSFYYHGDQIYCQGPKKDWKSESIEPEFVHVIRRLTMKDKRFIRTLVLGTSRQYLTGSQQRESSSTWLKVLKVCFERINAVLEK